MEEILNKLTNEEVNKFIKFVDTMREACPPGNKNYSCDGDCQNCWLKYIRRKGDE